MTENKNDVDGNDENVVDTTTTTEAEEATDTELEATLKKLKEQEDTIKAILAKNNELLDEKKKQAKARKEAEDKLRLEEEEKARKAGDWEKIVKAAEDKARAAEERAIKLEQQQREKDLKSQALQMATDMRGRPESFEILVDCIVKEIKNLVDEDTGLLSETNKTRVIENMMEMAKYKPLLLGNQSSGGGAEGNRASGAKSLKDMSEAEQIALFKKNPEKWKQLQATSGQ